MPEIHPEWAARAIALIDNAKNLCVGHERRPLAADVLRACRILVSGVGGMKSPDIDPLDELIVAVVGKNHWQLRDMFRTAASSIVGYCAGLPPRKPEEQTDFNAPHSLEQ